MHMLFKDYKDLLDESKGFGEKIIDEIVDNISAQITAFSKNQINYFKSKYDINIFVEIDEFRSNQAIIDALEDLMRLKDFHAVEYPNRLKCAAYLAYWWLQRQPILIKFEDATRKEEYLNKIKKVDLAHIIHANAYWLVAYVLGEIFLEKKLPCFSEQFKKDWKKETDFLFYYFCYRTFSPKDIEAFLSTAVLHPIWEIKDGVMS